MLFLSSRPGKHPLAPLPILETTIHQLSRPPSVSCFFFLHRSFTTSTELTCNRQSLAVPYACPSSTAACYLEDGINCWLPFWSLQSVSTHHRPSGSHCLATIAAIRPFLTFQAVCLVV